MTNTFEPEGRAPEPGEFWFSKKYGAWHLVESIHPVDGHLVMVSQATGRTWRATKSYLMEHYSAEA